MEEERVYYTIPEVAHRMGVSPVRAYQMAQVGELPAIRLSPRRIRVPRAAFDAWLAAQTAEALSAVGIATANTRG